MLLVPSVELTKGEPQPPLFLGTFHPLAIVGGLVGVMRKADRTVLPSLLARNATYVLCLVRYVTAAWRIVLLATWETAIGALIPPRMSRLTKYALRSLPSATTKCGGVASGTSTSSGPELPRSPSKLSRS